MLQVGCLLAVCSVIQQRQVPQVHCLLPGFGADFLATHVGGQMASCLQCERAIVAAIVVALLLLCCCSDAGCQC